MVDIHPYNDQDANKVWAILESVFRAGETYTIDPKISRDDALTYWTGGTHHAFVAGAGLGTYYIRPNQAGNGDHICNCGYITAPAAQGKGIARAMLEDSFIRARKMGFLAMQYNFVLANNNRALDTWARYGFSQIGRIPDAFRHPKDGMVDAVIMHRRLDLE